MKRVISQICQPEGLTTTTTKMEAERKMRILMYEWNLQQCFRATGNNYLLSLNFDPVEADDFMRKFVPLVLSAPADEPPVRKKQKSDPPALDQFSELTKAKLMAKMNDLGVTDYNPRWKKQQLIDHLEQTFAAREKSADNDRSPKKERSELNAPEEPPVSQVNHSTTKGVAAASPAKGLVQRAIAQHENRQRAAPREVSCESAVKKNRTVRNEPDEPAIVEVVDDPKPQEVIDVTMIEPDEDDVVEIVDSPAKPAPVVEEAKPPADNVQVKTATTPAKSSPSIQIGAVQSAKKLLLGQGLSDPLHQPVRFPRKQPMNHVVAEQTISNHKGAEQSVSKPTAEASENETRPQAEAICTPALKQHKTHGSPSYAYRMKERHAKLLMERNKRKDQLIQSKNPSSKLNLPSKPMVDLNMHPETLFSGPADAERVLKDLREKYKTGGEKSKTEYKAPATKPQMPLSAKPANSGNDGTFALSRAAPAPKPESKSVKSVQNNYPMTDTEDSDYDTDDSEANAERRARKHIPSWARTKNLMPVLEAQNDPSCPVDPDALFGVVTTCDLEAVFNRKSSRYRRPRTSGVWATANTAA